MGWNNAIPCVVREAEPGDLEDIRELHHSLCRFECNQGYDRQLDPDWSFSTAAEEYFRKRIAGGDGVALAVVAEDATVGYLLGRIDPSDSGPVGRLESVYVQPTCRRQGFGTQLLARFIEWASQRQLGKLTVSAAPGNAAAIGLYCQMGFRDATLILKRPG